MHIAIRALEFLKTSCNLFKFGILNLWLVGLSGARPHDGNNALTCLQCRASLAEKQAPDEQARQFRQSKFSEVPPRNGMPSMVAVGSGKSGLFTVPVCHANLIRTASRSHLQQNVNRQAMLLIAIDLSQKLRLWEADRSLLRYNKIIKSRCKSML